ncbi:MAG: hypothetical protein V1797_03250 [Pseudomonadota bacterium]
MAESKRRTEVRAERVDTKCGSVGHMTADEIKRRSIGDNVNLTCPECGEIHLTDEDASEAEQKKISETPRYKQIQSEAEQED